MLTELPYYTSGKTRFCVYPGLYNIEPSRKIVRILETVIDAEKAEGFLTSEIENGECLSVVSFCREFFPYEDVLLFHVLIEQKQDLFLGKWCILIKDKKTNIKHLNFLRSFWKKVGSKTVVMNSEKHDKIFSITSHLPHLIAYNLVRSAQDFQKKQKYNLLKYSGGGLRDFSRIAASNEIMWRDIFFDNRANVLSAIDIFIKNLNSFKRDINLKKNKSILKKLIQTKKVRSKIIKLKQDINVPDFGRSS